MSNIQFNDNSIKINAKIDDTAYNFLEEAAALLQTQVQRNSRVKTGQTKGSFNHFVDKNGLTAYVGSNYENAIWEEFGTGEYAINGDGRKGGWVYVDDEGKGVFTYGKHPSRAFANAYEECRPKIEKRAQELFGGIGND